MSNAYLRSTSGGSGGGATSVTNVDGTLTISPTVGAVVASVNAIAESQVTNLVADLAAKVPTTRTISTTSPLSGGGDLSADRTLTTSMNTNKLIGRGTAGVGVMEEITLGTNLSLSGTTLNAASGGAGASWTETEIDFGSLPIKDKTFTITDAAVSGSSKIMVVPSGNVATSRVGNDLEWDNLLLGAIASAGSFILTALAFPGPIVGKRKVFYTVG